MALKGMRVRPKQGWHYGSTRIEFYSVKNRCTVVAQSILEHMEFVRLEADPEVVRYIPHPQVILITEESGNQRAIFDAEVHYTDGRIIYEEIKYAKELIEGTYNPKDPFRSQRQTRLQEEWCKRKGYEYKIVTDEELITKNQILYNNCIFVTQSLRHERVENDGKMKALAMSLYNRINESGGKALINDLIADHKDTDEVEKIVTAICFLIREGLITTNMATEPICFRSEVRVNE